ncbi:MAG: ATP synthase F1 subunit delta [Clostridia bacterium]|nr:ATP synthase F1 subunit delta [Clostridia bacterium]
MSEISNEYAKALFMLSSEKECIEEYKNALEKVEEIFKENPMYVEFLYTFAIPLEERLNALEEVFSALLPRDVLSFLKILCEKTHIQKFHECAKYYYALYNEIDKISNVKVTSAIELSDKEKLALKEKLEKKTNKTAVIEYIVDESILGGIVLEADGKIIDSSIKKHLKDMKDVIKK